MSAIRSAAVNHPQARVAVVAVAAVTSWLALGVATAAAAPSAQASTKATAAQSAALQTHAAKTQTKTRATNTHRAASAGHSAGTKSDHQTNGTAGTSGDPTKPQPLSGADKNTGGANGQCPGGTYCSTRDGSPSGNGNGGGNATGKPCAGCVGKADNKNPPGQEKTDPFNTFPNNGYECDRNHGIGRTNPAHTGCQAATPPPCDETTEDCGNPPPCDETTEDCGNPPPCDETTEDCGNPPPCDATVENCGNTPPPSVEGEHHQKPTTEVLGEKVVRTPTALPFTGAAGLGFLVGTGAIALAAGGALTLAARRRRNDAEAAG